MHLFMLMPHSKISRLQKKQSKYFLRFKYANYFFTLLFLCGSIYVFFIFYTIIFSVFSGAEQVSALRASLSIEVINFNTYEKVKSAWDQRFETDLPSNTYDPFSKNTIFLEEIPNGGNTVSSTIPEFFSTSTEIIELPLAPETSLFPTATNTNTSTLLLITPPIHDANSQASPQI